MPHTILLIKWIILRRLSKSTPTCTRIFGRGLGLACIVLLYGSPCVFTVGFPIQTSYELRRILGILVGHKKFDVAAGVDLESRLRMIRLVSKMV